MTEKRKKYLDSISQEERFTRKGIHTLKSEVHRMKFYLRQTNRIPESRWTELDLKDAETIPKEISYAKTIIKALKKQLPAPTKLHKNEFLDFCSCSSCGWGVDFEQPYCQKCGQKLR